MTIKSRIKKARNDKGLSTYQLAEITGIPQSTISKLENGKRKPDLELLDKISEALNISTDKLTGEAASCIIEDKLHETGRVLEEVSNKTGVPLYWLQNLDDFIPGELGDFEIGYEWITKVARELNIPEGILRAALARQEIPAYDGEIPSIEESFGNTDFPEFVEENAEKYKINPDIRAIARAGDNMSAEDAKELRQFAERLFPHAFKKDNS